MKWDILHVLLVQSLGSNWLIYQLLLSKLHSISLHISLYLFQHSYLLAPPSGALVVSQFRDPVPSIHPSLIRFGCSNLLKAVISITLKVDCSNECPKFKNAKNQKCPKIKNVPNSNNVPNSKNVQNSIIVPNSKNVIELKM